MQKWKGRVWEQRHVAKACAFLCRRTESFAWFAIPRVILTLGEELGSAAGDEAASAADAEWSGELHVPVTSDPRALNLQSLGTISSPLANFNRFAFATISWMDMKFPLPSDLFILKLSSVAALNSVRKLGFSLEVAASCRLIQRLPPVQVHNET